MKLKKISTVGIALLSTLALAACSADGEAAESTKEEVTLWAGGSDNVRMTFESLADAFNESEYGEDYTLNIEFMLSGTGTQSLRDRLIAATKAGETDTDYDLVELGADEFAAYVSEGGDDIFNALDTSLIPNLENLEAKTASGQEYLMPYRGTTVVLAYDSEAVPTPPKTAEELYQWIKDNPGRFAYNTPGSGGAGYSFVTTSVYNFLPEEALTSEDAEWKEQWNEGFDFLKSLHPHLYQSGGQVIYPNKNQGTLDLLANKEVDMIPAWADMAIQQLGQGTLPETVKIAQIDPGFTGSLVTLATPKIGSNSEGAHAVMDFMLSEDAQSILLDEMAAIPLIDSGNLESENAAFLEGLDVSSFRTTSLGTLGTELVEAWDNQIAPLED